jgi:TolA-binding protein
MFRSSIVLLLVLSLAGCNKEQSTPSSQAETKSPTPAHDPSVDALRKENADLRSQVFGLQARLEQANQTVQAWNDWFNKMSQAQQTQQTQEVPETRQTQDVSGGLATGGSVQVHGYTRKNGTYVQPHNRAAPGSGKRR